MRKTKFRKFLYPFATFMLLMATPAWAKNIKYANIVIDTDMATGMNIGEETFSIKSNTNGIAIQGYELTDVGNPDSKSTTKSFNDDEDDEADTDLYDLTGNWNANYMPSLKITLETKDSDDRFKMSDNSDIKLSGSADPVFESISSSGSRATLTVRLRSLRTGAAALNNAHFDEDTTNGFILYFDETTEDMYYEVKLYRNGKYLGTYLTIRGEDYLDLNNIILQTGSYTASARVRNTATSTYSKWIEIDGTLNATQEVIDTVNNRSIVNPSSEEGKETSTTGRWMNNSSGWWWQEADNTYPRNEWKLINGSWYYFNNEGYILNGWQTINNVKYLFDDAKGYMKTGWQLKDNDWYYLNPSTGAMATGWRVLDGKYYCFESTTGKLYTNTYTPDGFEVNAKGEYTGHHKANIYDKYTISKNVTLYEVENVNYNENTFTMEVALAAQPMPNTIIASKGTDGNYTFYKVIASYPGKTTSSYSVYAAKLSDSEVAQFAVAKS